MTNNKEAEYTWCKNATTLPERLDTALKNAAKQIENSLKQEGYIC